MNERQVKIKFGYIPDDEDSGINLDAFCTPYYSAVLTSDRIETTRHNAYRGQPDYRTAYLKAGEHYDFLDQQGNKIVQEFITNKDKVKNRIGWEYASMGSDNHCRLIRFEIHKKKNQFEFYFKVRRRFNSTILEEFTFAESNFIQSKVETRSFLTIHHLDTYHEICDAFRTFNIDQSIINYFKREDLLIIPSSNFNSQVVCHDKGKDGEIVCWTKKNIESVSSLFCLDKKAKFYAFDRVRLSREEREEIIAFLPLEVASFNFDRLNSNSKKNELTELYSELDIYNLEADDFFYSKRFGKISKSNYYLLPTSYILPKVPVINDLMFKWELGKNWNSEPFGENQLIKIESTHFGKLEVIQFKDVLFKKTSNRVDPLFHDIPLETFVIDFDVIGFKTFGTSLILKYFDNRTKANYLLEFEVVKNTTIGFQKL